MQLKAWKTYNHIEVGMLYGGARDKWRWIINNGFQYEAEGLIETIFGNSIADWNRINDFIWFELINRLGLEE